MVDIVEPKIYTGLSQMEEFAEDFRNETKDMLKKIALENKIPVEELKFTVDSQSVVNVQQMTFEEMNGMEKQRTIEKKVSIIRERKGLSGG